MTRMIERWFPCQEVTDNSARGWERHRGPVSLAFRRSVPGVQRLTVSDPTRHRLADPPHCVRPEREPFVRVKLLGGPQQAEAPVGVGGFAFVSGHPPPV